MDLPTPLERAVLRRRYKRFLADVELGSRLITVHCPNPGSMLGLAEPGTGIWLMPAVAPGRKLPYGWELSEIANGRDPTLVGINAARANAIAAEAIATGAIPELAGYERVRREVRYGERSRVDFVLEAGGRPSAYVEVKNVHLMRDGGRAEFPDCVTQRGARHLGELAGMARAGHRAVMLYIVQRGDAEIFSLAGDLDPVYLAQFRTALAAGVEAICYACRVTRERIVVERALPIVDGARR